MHKYEIRIPIIATAIYYIEANSTEEAEELLEEKGLDDSYENIIIHEYNTDGTNVYKLKEYN